jgi:flagellar biogenesis protein FliO
MANEIYNCFGSGMINGNYGYGWMTFSWFIALLIAVGLFLFIVWMIKKIQNEDKKIRRSR